VLNFKDNFGLETGDFYLSVRTLPLLDIGVLQKPSLDPLSLKAPLIAHTVSWYFPLSHQPIDGEFVDFQVTGHLLDSQ
jgi:hypothetical protein